MNRYTNQTICLVAVMILLLTSTVAQALDPLSGLLSEPGSAGLGAVVRSSQSPYIGSRQRNDLIPLYIYEGERFFLHASRGGIKLRDDDNIRFDVFFDYRFEGFPYDHIPASLAGMQAREPTTDMGVSARYRSPWGTFGMEIVHDALGITNGSEIHLNYRMDWSSGRLRLLPAIIVSARSANLNNYYYGVRLEEATATRPAYKPGAGTSVWLGIYGAYDLSKRWRMVGGVGANRFSANVRHSSIIQDTSLPEVSLGAVYDFGSFRDQPAEQGSPLYVKLLYGWSTDCNLIRTMTLRCFSTSTVDNTRIAAIELGKPFMQEVNGWPLDFVGYVGLLRHDENGLQSNSLEVDAYMKAYYYGFPWSERVKTRLGLGAGLSLAQRVPFVEVRDQTRRGGNTSRVLNYLDPTIDLSVGDLLGVKTLKNTYAGVGVSHRSGIFGSSKLLGNVNGGSNYLYSYLEWQM
ncbi:MAG TPA: MipA/OmpV family protein [Gallionella sp.]|jgi:outer membrane protein|nr:MipA/OmpV family protein [Gallionella sp.]